MARKRKSSKKARKVKTLTEAKTKKQSLLNEVTIRRFQKLANLDVLSEFTEPKSLGKIEPQKEVPTPTKPSAPKATTSSGVAGLDRDTLTSMMKEDDTPDEEMIQEQELEEELPEEDLEGLEGEEDLEGLEGEEELGMEEEGEVDEGTVEDLVSAIADAITDATGIPVNVEGEEGGLEGEEGLEDLEGEEDLEGLEGLEGEEEMMPPEEELMQEARKTQQLRNYLISEVSNRIRGRVHHQQQQQALYEQQLQQQALYEHQARRQAVAVHENRKQQLAESLADRIFTRLKGKKRRK